ncbi:unnamed protein product [Haemonchus placei]|uniref:C2H2-type domain-containing protein n=1 Tax=Haemonchus placei TaxID=6290 RepID=A0A0N4VUQ3_HAEPC|nr:unnamed protein product [Haemonchus placei]
MSEQLFIDVDRLVFLAVIKVNIAKQTLKRSDLDVQQNEMIGYCMKFPCSITCCFQQHLSRSHHELDFIDATGGFARSVNTPPSPALQRRKSETELIVQNPSAFSLADNHRKPSRQDSDDRPVLRRRRYTRKQRKSVTIDPETSLILAAGAHSSSSDEELQVKNVSRALVVPIILFCYFCSLL